MIAWTDYPFLELGDKPFEIAPIRRCEVVSYDWNKYCQIRIDGIDLSVKIGYVYRKPGRCGEVPVVSKWKTKHPDGRPYWKYHKRRERKARWMIESSRGEVFDFETKREAIKKIMALPDFSTMYYDEGSSKKSWYQAVLEKRPIVPYRMKRRY